MSGPSPFSDDNPFGDLSAVFGQLAGLLGGGPSGWEHARQMAAGIANDGEPEPNVDPMERIRVEDLSRVAEMHIEQTTGLALPLGGRAVSIQPVNRSEWTSISLDAYKPLFEQLTTSLGNVMREQLDEVEPEDLTELGVQTGGDPQAFVNAIRQMLGPMMLTMMAGSTIGHLGRRSFGSYDLPIPRPLDETAMVVLSNVSAFANDWALPLDDLYMYVCLDQLAHQAVLNVAHLRVRLAELLSTHASSFSSDAEGLEAQLGELDLGDPEGMSRMQELMGDPEVILGAIRSPEQLDAVAHIDATVAVIEGFVDWTLDQIGPRLVGNYRQISEALRRRRVETDQASRFVERLFGLELAQHKLDRGAAFIDGVVERGGAALLTRLWIDAASLPTIAEIDAPGLWVARVAPDVVQELPELPLEDLDIPDFPDLDS